MRTDRRKAAGSASEQGDRDDLVLPAALADRLMPLHLRIACDGRVASAGPTLLRLMPGPSPVGQPFFDVFALRRPAWIADMAALTAHEGARLTLSLPSGPDRLDLRGILLRLPAEGGWLIDLSLGMHVVAAARAHGLTAADFAPSALTMELLYLVEAKAAVDHELRALTLRLQGARRTAEELALTDALTGLGNRRAMDRALGAVLGSGRPVAVMNIDLDYFKRVNDEHGHAAGDHVLCEVARVLREETREGDLVARVGGDEFTIVFGNGPDRATLAGIADRIIARLSRPILWGEISCRISASAWIVLADRADPAEAQPLLAEVDAALYESKRAGRNRVAIVHARGQPQDR